MPAPEPASEDLAAEARLKGRIRALGPPAVAFSGGVDSSYLLAVASEVHGPGGVRAFLGVSPALAAAQRGQARQVARLLGVALEEIATGEMTRPGYRANLGDRCYVCKDVLFAAIRERHPAGIILEGTNRDDLAGHRPGLRAAREHGIASPLVDAGLGKAAIRRLSRGRKLPTADLPASPCLASRFPAGVPVTRAGLRMVEEAEAFLRAEGFPEVRVRHHGDLARIEVPRPDLHRFLQTDLGDRTRRRLLDLGYRFVALDLGGFQSGSGSLLPPGPSP